MNPEKEIVNLWLNKNGFFTINDINAGKKVIDIIAIKHSNGNLDKIQHVEVSCSISSGFAEKEIDEYIKKFEDKTVSKKVRQVIKDFVGKEADYEKILVITSGKDFHANNVKTKSFDEILFDVVDGLDKQNYRNTTIRTLQLVKYLVLSNPKSMADLIEKEKGNKVMNQVTRELFIKRLLKQNDVKRIAEKQSNESAVIDVIKNSSLKKPERLAKAIENQILTSKTRKRFLKSLFEQKEMAEAGKQLVMAKNQKPLQYYLRKRKAKA